MNSFDIQDEAKKLTHYRSHVRAMWADKLWAERARKDILASLRGLLKLETGKASPQEFLAALGEPEPFVERLIEGWEVTSWEDRDLSWPAHWRKATPPPVPEGCTPVSFSEGDDLAVMVENTVTALTTSSDAADHFFAQVRYTLDVAKHEIMKRSVADANVNNRAIHKTRVLVLWKMGRGTEAEATTALNLTPTELHTECDLEASLPWGDCEIHDPNILVAETP